jgi:hypothetical protein
MKHRLSHVLASAALAGLGLICTGAYAQKSGGGAPSDGVITIDQTKALNGGVTPGDAAGFPVTISQPGHYRLSGPLTVADVNKSGIEINASNVTIDLNGFAITGPVTCTGSIPQSIACAPASSLGAGINSSGQHVTVRNGGVRGFAFGVFPGFFGRVEKMNVTHSANSAILAASGSIVQDNIVHYAGGDGVFVATAGEARGNTVYMAKANGVKGEMGALLIQNRVTLAGQYGIHANTYGNATLVQNTVNSATLGAVLGGVALDPGACNGSVCP